MFLSTGAEAPAYYQSASPRRQGALLATPRAALLGGSIARKSHPASVSTDWMDHLSIQWKLGLDEISALTALAALAFWRLIPAGLPGGAREISPGVSVGQRPIRLRFRKSPHRTRRCPGSFLEFGSPAFVAPRPQPEAVFWCAVRG